MKKLLAGLALAGVLSAGGVLVYSSAADNSEETESQKVEEVSVSTNASEEEIKVELPEAPTERTVDTQNDVPWKYMSAESIEAEQNNGEVVYLFSDAEALENYTTELAQNPDTSPYDKDELSTSWANHMGAFVSGVSEYFPNQEQYFTKIEEAQNAMASFNYEAVPTLIEEAKTLRESQ